MTTTSGRFALVVTALAVLLLASRAAGVVELNENEIPDYQNDYSGIDYDAEADAVYEYLMAHELDEGAAEGEPGGYIELTVEVNNLRAVEAATNVPEISTEQTIEATRPSPSNRRRLGEGSKPRAQDESHPKSYHGEQWEHANNPCSPGQSCPSKIADGRGFFSWIYGLFTGGSTNASKDLQPIEVDDDDDAEDDEGGENATADDEVEDDPDAEFIIDDGSPEDGIPETENTTGRCFTHAQCMGKLNAVDPYSSRWANVGKIYPEKPRVDPDPVQEPASPAEVRSCLREKNVGCSAERAGHVCKAIQSQKALSKVRKAHMANPGCMNMVIKKGPVPSKRYRTCAVIANGPGFNAGVNKTEIIDSYDAVFRNNYFPFSDNQGFRTTWRTMNNKRMNAITDRPSRPIIQPGLPKTTTYVGYTLLTNPGTGKKPKSGKKGKTKKPPTLQEVGKKLSKVTGSGVFTIGSKCKDWIKNVFGLVKQAVTKMKTAASSGKSQELSAGILNLMIALTKCEDVDIYGFGVSGGRMGSDSKVHINKTEVVSDRMSHFHDWALEQGVVRYLVAGGAVDLC